MVFVKGSEGKGRDVEKEMMEDVETVVKNALYFTRKLVQARVCLLFVVVGSFW